MYVIVYNLGILFYGLIIRLVAPFNEKAKLFMTGRKGLLEKVAQDFNNNDNQIVWFHCASLGEFEQGRPVIEAFKKEFPKKKILLTFFSPSGYELRKNYTGADFIYYLPLDSKSNAQRFLDITKPSMVIFVKYEFWFHYLNEVEKRSIPLFCISALFNPKQRFFKPNGGFFRGILKKFDQFFVQNELSRKLLIDIGIDKVSVAGDTRFDRVLATASNPKAFPLVKQFTNGRLTVVIGSCWPADMAFLFPIINQSKNIRFIIAPHNIGESHIRQIEQGLKLPFTRITEANETSVSNSDVLIINTIGMLSSLYQYGDLAYIGGAFGDGLHNILEAVTFGLPVIFGNNKLEKFPESTALVQKGGAFSFKTQEEINQYFNQLTTNTEFRAKTSAVCLKFIEENTGATAKIMQTLSKWKS
uniref:3-deoxy-D-manno-octulosonic acid transferase n=2 Tax=Roseivirga sp. TaxID=1964215 RepID=UPI00404806D8